MTLALTGYSAVFMRYAFAVTPKNYLLFGCHAVNFSAQTTQLYRYVQHFHMGGREIAQAAKERAGELEAGAEKGIKEAVKDVQGAVSK